MGAGDELRDAVERVRAALPVRGEGPEDALERLAAGAAGGDRALAGAWLELAEFCRGRGLLELAELFARRAIELRQDDAAGHHLLGIVLAMTGRRDEAVAALERAAAAAPDDPEVHNNLGAMLLLSRQYEPAVAAFERALSLRPDYPDAANNRLAALRKAAAAARESGRLDRAAELFRRAAEVAPGNAEVLAALGHAQLLAGHFEDAAAATEQALALQPDLPAGHLNRGSIALRRGQSDDAIAAFDRTLQIAPDMPRAHTARGMALLQKGDFAGGWREYEYRLRRDEHERAGSMTTAFPRWGGEPLAGKIILLHAEQGFGDAMQFVRYAPLVAALGGDVVLGCRAELKRFFRSVAGVRQVVGTGEVLPPRIDVQCPLMSLPLHFRTRLDNIPANVPYLAPPADRANAWRTRLSPVPGMRVGLTWAGNSTYTWDRFRSCPAGALAPLLATEGVTLFSLQLGGEPAPAGTGIIDHTADLTDWAETAALVANLDLVITVDTAVAHLAGALGRPTWLMLSAAPEWRWFRDRADSPWYPTMRLFRQRTWGDWRELTERVAGALAEAREDRERRGT